MHRKIIIGGIILAILLCLWFFVLRPKNSTVEMAVVERGDVIAQLVLSGGVHAREYASMYFPTGGKLAAVNVSPGDIVTKGQSLSRLDTTNLWATVQQADAAYRNAQASLNRVYDQVKGHEKDETYAQIETRTAAETAKDSAYFALVQARNNLSQATLNAPFSGVITNVGYNTPGVTVLATQPQIELINPETIYFTVFADQTEVNLIREGQKVEVILDAYLDETIEGTVTRVAYSPSTQEVGIVYPLEISLSKTSINGNIFRVGMTGDADFIINSVQDVLYVPPSFIKSDDQGSYLINKEGNKVYVEVGVEGDDRVEVKGDIAQGLQVYD